MEKKIAILTGGGDVPPLNALIASAAETARAAGAKLIGFIKGWQGVLEEKFVELTEFPLNPEIGGTVLKSSRTGLGRMENGPEKALGVFAKLRLEGLIVVGGEDTLSNAFRLGGFRQVLIAKTIDNDVGKMDVRGNEKAAGFDPENVLNYFNLGFPTAAEKIASFVSLKEGLRTTAYSHERIIVVEAMGMHAGWLALAAGLGNPDFIIIPEFPLDYERFLDAVISAYERRRHLIIVAAEGAKWADGSFISAEDDEGPDYGHPRFGGAAEALKSRLKKDLADRFDTRNVNAVNPSYLYRAGASTPLDRVWADRLGRRAVEIMLGSGSETSLLTIQKRGAGFEVEECPLSGFASMAELHRFVDGRFYDPVSFGITEAGKNYLKEIAHEFILEGKYGLPD
ncbi:MAG: 6-phosphofructokinase [Candidatus Aminicenantales bacterium]